MTYGIAGLADGMNRGIQQRRDIKRQDQQDARAQETHELGIQTSQANLQAADQQYGIRDAEFSAWQDDRGRASEQQQFNDDWKRAYQRYEMTGDPSALADVASQTMFEGTPAQIQPGENGFQVQLGDQQFEVPREEFDAWARSMVDPGARTQYQQQIQQQIAEQRQGAIDHDRKLEVEQTKGQYGIERQMIGRMAPGSVRMDEEGGFAFQEPPGGLAGGGQPTAKMREVVALAQAQGIPEAEAWDRILNSSGQPPEQAIPAIAKLLMDADRNLRRDPEGAIQQAREMYLEFRQMQTGQYGIGGGSGQPNPGQQDPATQPARPDGTTAETAIPMAAFGPDDPPPQDGQFVERNGIIYQFRGGRPVRVDR